MKRIRSEDIHSIDKNKLKRKIEDLISSKENEKAYSLIKKHEEILDPSIITNLKTLITNINKEKKDLLELIINKKNMDKINTDKILAVQFSAAVTMVTGFIPIAFYAKHGLNSDFYFTLTMCSVFPALFLYTFFDFKISKNKIKKNYKRLNYKEE